MNRLHQLVHLSGVSASSSSGEFGDLDSGGKLAARALVEQGVTTVFTLTGGHIAPIIVGCSGEHIRVIDVRDEATAVFAADALGRLSGVPGVAIVTAGPGLSNTITAVKNAQLAQSALVVLCGATSLLLKGRGSLQDVDQIAMVKPHVKWAATVTRVGDITSLLRKAFSEARKGVPGPVMLEFPLDTIWPRKVLEVTLAQTSSVGFPSNFTEAKALLQSYYLSYYYNRMFRNAFEPVSTFRPKPVRSLTSYSVSSMLSSVVGALLRSHRPVILVGSQAMTNPESAYSGEMARALEAIGVPVYLSGMARGLLGPDHPIQFRHKRSSAFKQADFVVLAGASADFRVDYGRHIPGSAYFVMVNLSPEELALNSDMRARDTSIQGDSDVFLTQLAHALKSKNTRKSRKHWESWKSVLQSTDDTRSMEIRAFGDTRHPGFVNPVYLCEQVDAALDANSIIVADGGDFVGTASYILRPRSPLSWLDPGVFGTLGVGGGFALASKAFDSRKEVWVMFGDGACGWSLVEIDTMVRNGLAVIMVVGNDACWMQMHRDQGRLLGDEVATTLSYTHYETVAEGFGAKGILVRSEEEVGPALKEAKRIAATGTPVLVNAILFRSRFREGSISL